MQAVEGLLAEIGAMRQRIEALEKRVGELEAEDAALRAENAPLCKALEDERRAGNRHASPFSRGIKKQNPKKPGRKASGVRSRREIPAKIDRKVVVSPLLICPQCAEAVRLEKIVRQY